MYAQKVQASRRGRSRKWLRIADQECCHQFGELTVAKRVQSRIAVGRTERSEFRRDSREDDVPGSDLPGLTGVFTVFKSKKRLSISSPRKMSDPFRFKQFSIHQDRCAMKVGTDGILLGAWATAETPSRILDIGTGTGVVALMLAQRFPAAMIDAVEANSDACGQAAGNFQVSPWADRLTAVYCRIQEFESAATYSLIVSNPPWFHDSMKPDDQARDTARHTDSMSPADLISAVARLMANDGVFTTILPVVEGQSFLGLAAQSGFHCHRCCEVLPLANVPAFLVKSATNFFEAGVSIR